MTTLPTPNDSPTVATPTSDQARIAELSEQLRTMKLAFDASTLVIVELRLQLHQERARLAAASQED